MKKKLPTPRERVTKKLEGMGFTDIHIYCAQGFWKRRSTDTPLWQALCRHPDYPAGRCEITSYFGLSNCAQFGFTVEPEKGEGYNPGYGKFDVNIIPKEKK